MAINIDCVSLNLSECFQVLELSDAAVKGLLRVGIHDGRFCWYGKIDAGDRLYCCLAPWDDNGQILVYYSQSQFLELQPEVLTSDIVGRKRRTPPIPLKPR